MEMKEDFFTGSKEALQEYIDDRILLIKLQATDKVSQAAGSAVTLVLSIIFCIVLLLLLGITGGLFFTDLTGSPVTGFAIITGIYIAIALIVLFALKKTIESSVTNSIIKKIFSKETLKTENNEQRYN